MNEQAKQVIFSSKTGKWDTPKEFYQALDKEFNFDHDPCPANPEINGILCEGWGKRNFVNPEYGPSIYAWIEKGVIELQKGNLSVFLLPARTDTAWFHELVLPFAKEIRFIRGRLKFVPRTGWGKDTAISQAAPFPSIVVIFEPKKVI